MVYYLSDTDGPDPDDSVCEAETQRWENEALATRSTSELVEVGGAEQRILLMQNSLGYLVVKEML